MVACKYNIKTQKEYFKINFYSDLLFDIETNILLKRIYPIYSCNFFNNKNNIELYKSGKKHYNFQLKLKKK